MRSLVFLAESCVSDLSTHLLLRGCDSVYSSSLLGDDFSHQCFSHLYVPSSIVVTIGSYRTALQFRFILRPALPTRSVCQIALLANCMVIDIIAMGVIGCDDTRCSIVVVYRYHLHLPLLPLFYFQHPLTPQRWLSFKGEKIRPIFAITKEVWRDCWSGCRGSV